MVRGKCPSRDVILQESQLNGHPGKKWMLTVAYSLRSANSHFEIDQMFLTLGWQDVCDRQQS